MTKTRPTTTRTTTPEKQIQRFYGGVIYYDSWSIYWYTRHEQNFRQQQHILGLVSMSDFSPLDHSHDSSCSYYINTVNYSNLLHIWLHDNIKSVAEVLSILFLSFLRCLFVLHMQPILPLIYTTLQHGISIQSRHDDRISLWNDAYTL